MRKGRCCALLGMIFLVGIISLPWWISSKKVESAINYFLAPHYSVKLANDWTINHKGLTLPTFQVNVGKCMLADLYNIQLNSWISPHLVVENAYIDYACVQHIPSNNDKTPIKLTALFAAMPNAEINIKRFQFLNAKDLVPPIFHDVLNTSISATVSHHNEQFQLDFSAQNDKRLILQHHSMLSQQDNRFVWQGKTDYQPEEKQHYQSRFFVRLNDDILQLHPQGEMSLTWQNPHFSVSTGEASLSWLGENGQLKAQDLTRHSPLLDIPFVFTQNGLEISWGTFYWTFDGYQPIKGFLGLSLRTPSKGWLPFGIDTNIIVQTFGEYGKGEIVISGENGEIGGGENLDQIRFNLKTRGDLRYNNTVAQTNLTYHLGGTFSHPLLRFNPGSIFKMDNQQQGSNIHMHLPLDNVQISKYGLDGRLSATLQGFTPQFSDIDMKLDGQADEFIAGIKTVFELRDPQQKLQNAEMNAKNRWDWTIQGKTYWNALKTQVNLQGIGFWQGNYIELNQLSATSNNVKTNGIAMAPLSLELKDRLRWDYEKNHIRGLLQAKSDWIAFDYGGRFVKPVFGVGIDGESIGHFNVAGDLKAGALGPIDLFARYEDQRLKGKISWKSQSAKVFQSLFPQQWGWLIHRGLIKGVSDFQIDQEGIGIKGNLNLHNATISFPDGEIEDLDIHFPLNYQNNVLQNLSNNPIKVSVRNMRNGALYLNDATFNLSGTYPYSRAKPLTLSNVRIGLFDGEMTLDKLNFPQHKIATLKFRNIDLQRVMTMAQYNQIYLEGRINATLPFWLDNHACFICNGTLEQVDKMRIRLNDEVVNGLKKGGFTENMMVDLLKEMELEHSSANLDLASNGQMNLRATIKGFNMNKPTHHPITLNYHHQENMFELWNMIDYGAQFEQNLQYRLYQNLEYEKTP
ncbi:YdbH family protein [Rodentibacter trehalosifermentans]|uniref:Uncharacterized protein n=1 Tax=Rodentibacter trehalosifermentans TaxID=1908263 RepID=A0A1V3IUV9_9PAST|nr:YdbH family protein [Rodentibacter trehalosifermentans]OOF46064.1 hypothetical protein BKK51_04215 [Rodentibacter trehalosifermentans]OOF49846.1 hypothetical protein BKK53_08395 [Rodentibacter trehalosifermentans]